MQRLAAAAAGQHVNEEAVVCGFVAGARYAGAATGRPTFLDFDKSFPNQTFSVVIWGPERAKFEEAPETAYLRRNVCVTGSIQVYGQRPEIVVRDPAQLILGRR